MPPAAVPEDLLPVLYHPAVLAHPHGSPVRVKATGCPRQCRSGNMSGSPCRLAMLSRCHTSQRRFPFSLLRRALLPARHSHQVLRPAMTPPSISQMAPVTHSVFSDSRNTTVSAISTGVPTRPIGWKLSKLFITSFTSSFGIKPS